MTTIPVSRTVVLRRTHHGSNALHRNSLIGTSRSALTLKVFSKIASRIELPCIFRVARWAYAYMSRSRPSPLSFQLTLAAKTQVEVKSRHKNSTAYLSCHTEAYHRRARSGGDKNVDLS